MCLQWLREYQRDAALPHKESIAWFTDHSTGYLSARQLPKIDSFHSVRANLRSILLKFCTVFLMYVLYSTSAKFLAQVTKMTEKLGNGR